MLIGSHEAEVVARLGISAEIVERIVENQLQDDGGSTWRASSSTWAWTKSA